VSNHKSLKAELLSKRAQIKELIEQGDLITIDSIGTWLSSQGAKEWNKKHLAKSIKVLFPEYVLNNRWAPVKSLINRELEKDRAADNGRACLDKKEKKPEIQPKKKEPHENIELVNNQDSEEDIVYVMKDGTELDKGVLKFIDREELESGNDTVIMFTIRAKRGGARYLNERIKQAKRGN